MKAIFINAKSRTVEEIQLDSESQARMVKYRDLLECKHVQQIGITGTADALLVNEYGAKRKQNIAVRFGSITIFGNGLLIGVSSSNDAADYNTPIDVIRQNVTFYNSGQTARIRKTIDTAWHIKMRL